MAASLSTIVVVGLKSIAMLHGVCLGGACSMQAELGVAAHYVPSYEDGPPLLPNACVVLAAGPDSHTNRGQSACSRPCLLVRKGGRGLTELNWWYFCLRWSCLNKLPLA